ncbi:SH3 domain-containing protein [Telmatospirillum sp. J64-1]|uniref:SH3 domain-containing protein n=1 Tax=Telmatospirillum sp. J64-1 TaxID=2502183 RepID=UPI00115CD573|nr:SH3 domain-containing protein [Telmatospirillum sp. J64-1]
MMRAATSFCLLLVLFTLSAPVAAQGTTGLPLPRFLSLRSDEVNLRTGPGTRYPVDWTYTRRDLPVEVIAEFEAWRRIRDWQGTEGWVHQSMLSGRRMMVVTGTTRPLRRTADASANAIALVEPDVIGRLQRCPRDSEMCQVEVGGHVGWMRRDEFWGVYSREAVD